MVRHWHPNFFSFQCHQSLWIVRDCAQALLYGTDGGSCSLWTRTACPSVCTTRLILRAEASCLQSSWVACVFVYQYVNRSFYSSAHNQNAVRCRQEGKRPATATHRRLRPRKPRRPRRLRKTCERCLCCVCPTSTAVFVGIP